MQASVSFDQIADSTVSIFQRNMTPYGDKPTDFVSDAEVLAVAPNIIEFTVGSEWLDNPSTFKHVRQYQILRDFFQLRCPICNSLKPDHVDCWGKGREYLESENLLIWSSKYRDEICPKCHTTKQEFIEDGIFAPLDALVGCAGMRSGKSVTAGIIGNYFEHRVNTWYEPIQATLEVVDSQPLQISFVASTGTQAAETVWAAYKMLRQKSPWFKKYAVWIKNKERNQVVSDGQKPWQYDEGGTRIENGMLDLIINSLNSNSSGIAGRTRLAAIIDELSRFDSTESKQSADEMYRVLNQSLRTVRGRKALQYLPHWLGLMISISSPISVDDKTMQLLNLAPNLRNMFSFHYSTWDFNPFQPKESFQEEYDLDPVGAERDYGANPPNAETPLVDDIVRFEKSVDPTLQPIVEFRGTVPSDELGREYVGKEVIESVLDPEYVHYLFFDAGSSFDSFAGASYHPEWIDMTDVETGGTIRTLVVVQDWVMSIRPVLKPRRTVFFDCIVEMVDTISKRQKIGAVGFDRWNSESLIQSIRNLQISAEYYSLKYKDFQFYVQQAYMGRIKMLPVTMKFEDGVDPRIMDDQSKVLYELKKLQRSKDLKKVFNPLKGKVHGLNSDDLAHSVVGAHRLVHESFIEQKQSSRKEKAKREMSAQPFGVGQSIGQQTVIIPGKGSVEVGYRPPEEAYAIGPNTPGRIGQQRTPGSMGHFRRW